MKSRLRELWTAVFPRDDQPYTSVVVAYRAALHEVAARIAPVLARNGVSSRLSVEFPASCRRAARRSSAARATVGSESYRGLLPEDLVEILTIDHLGFNQRSETGVLFHMIGAVSQFGRLGMMAIGDTRAEADQLFFRTLRVLDHETRFGGA